MNEPRRKPLAPTALVLLLSAALACTGARPVQAGATVSIAVLRADPGPRIASGLAGFSYEKSQLSKPLFDARNAGLIALFRRLGPGLLRVGGNSVERTRWDPSGQGLTQGTVAPADLERLAGFLRATGWRILYGLNLGGNTPEGAAAEAARATAVLGDRLLGFEIGNEPDLYHKNGLRPPGYAYEDFREEWEAFARAIRAAAPGAVLAGPADAEPTQRYALRFAADEAAWISLLTQHYYRANGRKPSSTMEVLLDPDARLAPMLADLRAAAGDHRIPGGWLLGEANSFFHGGRSGVSDAFGSALWAIDFLFRAAASGGGGVALHGGGRAWYTPIADDGARVTEVRPEFYGMLVFAMASGGDLLRTRVEPGDHRLSAWAVAAPDGSTRVVLLNEDPGANVSASIDLGARCSRASLTRLEAPSLDSLTGVTLQGAPILPDGSWQPSAPEVVKPGGPRLTLTLRAGSAVLVEAR